MLEGDIVIRHFHLVEDLKPLVYILAVISLAVVISSLVLAYRRWTAYGEKIRVLDGSILTNLLTFSLLQYRVLRHRFPGLMHLLIFAGILWLFTMTVLRALDNYFGPFLVGDVWKLYKFLGNIAGLSVITGSLIAIARRYYGLTPNLPRDYSYYLVHLLLIVIVITGFALNGLAAASYRAEYESPLFDPIGYIFYTLVSQLSFDEIRVYYRVLWVIHLFIAMATIALIPFTNLWHIIASNLNIALSRRAPSVGALRSYPDIDERISSGLGVGITKLRYSMWKQRLDWDACTNCMRCTNSCPAYASGKPLDPRLVIVTMRELMYNGRWDDKPWGSTGVDPDAIWSCVTCGACVFECPVLIHHVDTIIDVRRGMISVGDESVPEGVLNSISSMQYLGNPLGSTPVSRDEWLEELKSRFGDDIIARPDVEYEYLYWPGCVTVYDPRVRSVAESLIELLRRANIKVAVIPDNVCTGDPALRMGEELMFIEKAVGALDSISKYRFKKILVNCPHCYTAFKWEYARYRDYIKNRLGDKAWVIDKLNVEHHTILLYRLIREGRIKPGSYRAIVTYHDPCYLGRWNNVFEEPRGIIKSIRRLNLIEMPRSRDRSFCCGGGGGQLFYEVKKGERISRVRSEEAAKTLAEGSGERILAVSCPYCNVMFRGEAEQFNFKVMDIAEILAESTRS
ncbi:MAG: heterodisulfide reductase-related iron-sulfur binding cluster [Acidilobaceae archaeon]